VKEILGKTSWILVGDLNLIKDLGEKKGGVGWMNLISISFQYTIQGLGVEDIDFINGSFT